MLIQWRETESEDWPAFLELVKPLMEKIQIVPSAFLPKQLGCLAHENFEHLQSVQHCADDDPYDVHIWHDKHHDQASDRQKD